MAFFGMFIAYITIRILSEYMLVSSLIMRDITRDYPCAVEGKGIYLYDSNGREYIDASSGSAAVSNLGHGVREIITAITEEANWMAYCPSHFFANKSALKLGETIASLTPGNLNDMWFVSSGSEATENAVKIARQFHVENGDPSRHIVIGRWQSYHGATLGALGYGGLTSRRRMYVPQLFNSPHIPPVYCYRCPYEKTYPGCGVLCARELESTIQRIGPENISAFIAEPVVGAALGAVPPVKEYFPMIKEICSRYGVLFIDDEVMTGFGRTGKLFGINHWDVEPDLMVMAKGISAGYMPLSAVAIRDDFSTLLRKNSSNIVCGHTYSAHHIAAAAGLAAIQYMLDNNVVEKAAESGAYFHEKLKTLYRYEIVGDVRGLGLFAGIEFVRNRKTKEPFPTKIALGKIIGERALKKGLITYPGSGSANGIAGDHVLLAPPLIIKPEEIDRIVSILDETLNEISGEMDG